MESPEPMALAAKLRECLVTNFDQTLIGKRSSAGRFTRNAGSVFGHSCGGTRVRAAARLEIFCGARDLIASCVLARAFPLGGFEFEFSSGNDFATQLPAPLKDSRYPSASNCSYAPRTGIREIFNSAARCLR